MTLNESGQTVTNHVSMVDTFLDNTTLSPDIGNNDLINLRNRMNQIQYFICPSLFFIGLTGNICTLLTVSRSQFRHLTSRYILCALAVSDSLLLCTNPFNQNFMKDLWNRDIRVLSTFGCKLYFVMYRVGKMSASWFIVLVAVERFLAVMFPLKAKLVLQKKTIAASIAVVYIFMVSFSSIWTFSTRIVNGICRPDSVTIDNRKLHKSFVIIGAGLYSLIPILLLLTMTPPIIVKLLRRHQQRRQMLHSAISQSARETSRITIMLIGIVIAYIIWVTPITVVLIMTFWNNQPIFGASNYGMVVFQTVALTFEQLNHSSNFFIYVMCSRQFRKRFLIMVGCGSLVRKDTIHASSSSVTTGFNKD